MHIKLYDMSKTVRFWRTYNSESYDVAREVSLKWQANLIFRLRGPIVGIVFTIDFLESEKGTNIEISVMPTHEYGVEGLASITRCRIFSANITVDERGWSIGIRSI